MPDRPLPLLWGVLHIAVSERPILRQNINQIDKDVLLAHAGLGVEVVSDLPVKCLLHFGAAPGVPRNLDEDNVIGVIDAKVSLPRETPAPQRRGQ